MLMNVTVKKPASLFHIQEVLILYTYVETGRRDRQNFGTVPQIRQWLLLYTAIKIHYPPIIQFITVEFELLTVSLHKL
jgi:hypothetical protein